MIDVDLAQYCDSIDHKLLEGFLRKKIKDERFMRYVVRMLKAGVLTRGELKVSEEGVVQGSICSPVLANIFAHHVIDEWMERDVKPRCKCVVRLFRYCEDAVICCESESDARRVKDALGKRLAKFGLKLNEEKTKLVDFGKTPGRRTFFDFLGFTFYLGRSKKGCIVPKLKTTGKRIRAKLKRVNEWARSVKDKMTLEEIWKRFCLKLRGHVNYYGVSQNTGRVQLFLHKSAEILFKWLNRRSQRKSFTWDSFRKYIERYPLQRAKVYHKLF